MEKTSAIKQVTVPVAVLELVLAFFNGQKEPSLNCRLQTRSAVAYFHLCRIEAWYIDTPFLETKGDGAARAEAIKEVKRTVS